FEASNLEGFDFDTVWGNSDNQTTPWLRGLAGNQVFNKNDLPSGTINATNRPELYTALLNIDQLQAMQNDLAGRYLLGLDIDASATRDWNDGAGFAPVGVDPSGDSSRSFTGTFDGLGHTLRDLTIKREGTDYIGLFGYVDTGSTLRHVGLVDGNVTGRNYVGGLVGYNRGGTITHAYATGAVSGNKAVGGLVGINNGSITHAYATGAVSGDQYVGGLVGGNDNGTISHAYATGAVSGNQDVGGLAGINTGSSITHAYYATTDSDGDAINSGEGYNTLGEGKTLVDLKKRDTFADWGSDIDAAGGTGTVWRLYEGFTTPLLRRFLQAVTVTASDTGTLSDVVYNGSVATGASDYTSNVPNASVLGSLGYTTDSKNVATYSTEDGKLTLGGLYSDQQGYDISYADAAAELAITPRPVTVTADDKQKTVGNDDPALTYRTGCASGQTADCGLVAGESLAGDLSRESGEAVGGYAIEQGSVTQTNNRNYAIDFVPSSLTIAAAPVDPEPTPPVDPEPTPPVDPEPTPPVDPEPTPPVDPEPTPPVDPEPTPPVDPEPTPPVDPEPTPPVDPEPTPPVDPEPTPPVDPEPTPPVDPEPTPFTSSRAPQIASAVLQRTITDLGRQGGAGGTTASSPPTGAALPDTTSSNTGEEDGARDGLALVEVSDEAAAQRTRESGFSGLIVIRGGINTDAVGETAADETDMPIDNNL
ncbi:hypothetical protein E0L35_24220, partial [Halomonas sp. ATBC28]|uniref:MBG-2 domain-containing protein n=1 Tax=Halomonas sp. ATBC28 TaxID=2545264 RepID=UPI001486BEAF